MQKTNLTLTPQTSAEWLASCGFIFPRNTLELTRFNSLYPVLDPGISGDEVNPHAILKRSARVVKMTGRSEDFSGAEEDQQMVAHTLSPLPSHIVAKLKPLKSGK